MRFRVYMRLARTPRAREGFKVDASPAPNPEPLKIGTGRWATPLHTVRFALVLDVPDGLLRPADWPVIEVALDEDQLARIPIEVAPEPIEAS